MGRSEIYATDMEYAEDVDAALAIRAEYALGLGHITDFEE